MKVFLLTILLFSLTACLNIPSSTQEVTLNFVSASNGDTMVDVLDSSTSVKLAGIVELNSYGKVEIEVINPYYNTVDNIIIDNLGKSVITKAYEPILGTWTLRYSYTGSGNIDLTITNEDINK